jgi:hypothetical protein
MGSLIYIISRIQYQAGAGSRSEKENRIPAYYRIRGLVVRFRSSVTCSAVGQTFVSAGEADFLVRWIEACGDWKVATTGRLESLPYVILFMPAHT